MQCFQGMGNEMENLMMVPVVASVTVMSFMAETETVGGCTWTYRIVGDIVEMP